MNELAAGAVRMTEYFGSFNLFARFVALFQALDPTMLASEALLTDR